MSNDIELKQTNPEPLATAHEVKRMVISPLSTGPLSKGGLLQETALTASIHEFLFEMRKDGHVYWVGAAVPKGTSDFSQAQVFFHPTVVQAGTVHATEGDYATFRGGWSSKLQRYVSLQGSQLAAARRTPLIVPFMTMTAHSGKAPAYMFANQPIETLNAIMTAVRDAVNKADPLAFRKDPVGSVKLARMGVSSFSSGIGAMRLFIRKFGESGLIAETTDFDSPFIVAEPKIVTRSPKAVGRVFTQIPPLRPDPGWTTLSPANFRNVQSFKDKGAHAQIGWMMFFVAAMGSVIA